MHIFSELTVEGVIAIDEETSNNIKKIKEIVFLRAQKRRLSSNLYSMATPIEDKDPSDVKVSCSFDEKVDSLVFTSECEGVYHFCIASYWQVVEFEDMDNETRYNLRESLLAEHSRLSSPDVCGVINGFIPFQSRFIERDLCVWYNGDIRPAVFHLDSPKLN